MMMLLPLHAIARLLRRLGLAAMLGCAGLSAWAQDGVDATLPRAVIFTYGRFGDDGAANSISVDLFEQHLSELSRGGYTVLPLPEIVAALRDGRPLPDRTIGITIDDTHASVWREAWPRLRALGLPFTLFVVSDTVDRAALPGGSNDSMTWGQIRDLADAGVTIGNLSASHPHLMGQDRAFQIGQIARAAERIAEQTGTRPTLFAYPFGEYDSDLRALVPELGYRAAFGQQSGVAHGRADPMALPRFAMSDTYGSLDRFRLAAQALPLLVQDVTPSEIVIEDNPPTLRMTIDPMMGEVAQLACFISGAGRMTLVDLGNRRIELRAPDLLAPGRTRLNCTMPAADGRWRWFGLPLVVP